MAIKISQGLKQQQSLMMTPQLQQAIKLLTLTHMEMTDLIASEMVENPMLEEAGNEFSQKELERPSDVEAANKEATSDNFSGPELVDGGKEQFDWDKYIEAYNSNSSSPPSMVGPANPDETPNYENMISRGMSLPEHLLWQLRMEELDQEEMRFAHEVIHNIDEEGYLAHDLEEIIENSGLSRNICLDLLHTIQNLDPVGCGARDLGECLLIQAQSMAMRTPLVEGLIKDHLKDLQNKDYGKIEKALGIDTERIKQAEQIILNFNPKPGRLVSSEDTHYVVPDIYVREVDGELVATLNDDGVPRLKISNLYRKMLQAAKSAKNGDDQDFVKDRLKSAEWLIKSIENRQKTIMKVTEAILKYQPEFFKKGAVALKPMILKDIAQEIDMHESTVSRVTTNKYMHTPIGLFELKYFFNAGIGGKNGGVDIAGETLKLKIKELIANENPQKPLSDQKISQILETQEIKVARRTVAKYREMMNILPSSKRKQKK